MKEKDETNKTGGAGFPACVGMDELHISRRRLPHWYLPGSTYFITFRLKSGTISDGERKIVLDAIKHFHKIKYLVTAAVVRPDHIHLMMKQLYQDLMLNFL